jgi:hypothetical protein
MLHCFEFKTHLLSHISELKIRARFIFEALFITLPRRASDLAKRAVNVTDSEMYLLVKIVDSHKKFLNAKRLMLYHAIRTDAKFIEFHENYFLKVGRILI